MAYSDVTGGIAGVMKYDDEWKVSLQQVDRGRKLVSVCNLIQKMYNTAAEGKADAITAALLRVPKSGPYAVPAKLGQLASSMT